MFKSVWDTVWLFDCEWVPDHHAGRLAYGLPLGMPESDVIATMFSHAGATPENPRPYLKTALCRIVALSAIKRTGRGTTVSLELKSLCGAEREIIEPFLRGVGKVRPQLVGYNSKDADLPALIQRAITLKIAAPAFCQRPAKPWEGVDYFDRYSDAHVDLKQVLSGFGRSTPTQHEIASACGIPSKIGVTGTDVLDLWTAGRIADIVRYNQGDCVTLYLLFLRVALLAGFVTDEEHDAELAVLRQTFRDIDGLAPYLA